jgi:demethylmenaquinone methyltransferase / 2-methoxy-6-polyprenyl-1,4-benzoquinol methylase
VFPGGIPGTGDLWLHRTVVSERTRHARTLFAGLPGSYEAMGALLSFGQDPRWRRFLVDRVASGSAPVLDVAAGTGLVTRALLQRGRAERVVALDQSDPMLRAASRIGGGTLFVLGQAERLPFPDATFDALTVTYLLRYVDDPGATLRELVRVVRPGGTIASLEFAVPTGLAYPAWWLYTRLVMPAVGRLASHAWYEVGRFLGPSIEGFWERYPLASQVRMWQEAGVGAVRWRRMSLGGGIVVWGAKGA